MENLLIPLEFRQDETRQSLRGFARGVLMTYGTKARDREEMFEMNSLHWDPSGIVDSTNMHNRQAPILRAIPYLEGRELRINAPLPQHHQGQGYCRSDEGTEPAFFWPYRLSFRAEKESRRGRVESYHFRTFGRGGTCR